MSEEAPAALPKHAVIEASKGTLQKQLYAVFTTPAQGLGPVLANMGPHLGFQAQLEADGVLFAAGPMWNDDETEWHGEGIVVIRAASRAEAEAIAARDPMHASGARTFRVRPWMINEGSVTITMNFATQKLTVL